MKIMDFLRFVIDTIATDKTQKAIFFQAWDIYKITIEKVDKLDNWKKVDIICIDDVPRRFN